jgi:UDP-glucose 4-epimerase
MKALILRLENIVGQHYSHGVIIDFINKLEKNPERLDVLGDGQQRKAFLHIADLCTIVEQLMRFMKRLDYSQTEVFNIGNLDWIFVSEIAGIVCEEMNLNPKIIYGSSTIGFKGDIPVILMSKSKMLSHCKRPILSSRQAVRETVRWILNANEER